jgi:hypothetical protein
MKIQNGVTKSIPVEYVLLSKGNLTEAAKWCNGVVAGLSGVEYCTEGLTHAVIWNRARIGQYLLKANGKFTDYMPEEFERLIDASPDE